MSLLASFESLNDTAGALLAWLGAALLYGSVLAIVTWGVVRFGLRHTRPALVSALWLIVLLKFLIPVGPGFSFSMASAVSAITGWLPVSSGLLNADTPQRNKHEVTPADGATTLMWVTEGTTTPTATVDVGTRFPLAATLVALYAAGVIVVGAVRIRSYHRFAAACRMLPLAPQALAALVAAACRRYGVRREPVVRISDAAPAPFILGTIRPTLVLSPRQLSRPEELEAVVLHEIAHLRRGDLLVRYVQWLAGTVLFFWPVVAWVNRRIDLAREHACDEWALRYGRLSAGDYARCLLRAVQPASGVMSGYRPAAMAANSKHVERRIEMILDSMTPRRRHRLFGIAAGAALLGWSGFVLTGANASSMKKTSSVDDPPRSTEDVQVVVVRAADADGAPGEDILMHLDGLAGGGECGAVPIFALDPSAITMMIADDDDAAGGAQPKRIMMSSVAGLGPRALERFAADHPTADANHDGTLSKAEHDAFLVAVALSNPKAVLAQFPKADRNSDGTLSADEAARLAIEGLDMPAAGKWVTKGDATFTPGDGHSVVIKKIVNAPGDADAPGGQPMKVRVIHQSGDAAGDAGAAPMKVIVRAGEGADIDEDIVVGAAGEAGEKFELPLPVPAGQWMLKNISATPTAADVARYVTTAEQAPLAVFLENNPKADANGDGKLTAEERATYLDRHMSRMRQKMLEKHPEADANSDGLLTNDEMTQYFRAKHKADGAKGERRVKIVRNGEVVSDTTESISGDAKEVRVEVIKDGAAPEPR